jgi:hypothetical protein
MSRDNKDDLILVNYSKILIEADDGRAGTTE